MDIFGLQTLDHAPSGQPPSANCRSTCSRCRCWLGPPFLARRVVRARVVNIVEPVDLYEIATAGSAEQAEFFRASEEALALEAEEFARAARLAGQLLSDHPGDGPLLLVLSRAAHVLISPGPWNPVWEPPGK